MTLPSGDIVLAEPPEQPEPITTGAGITGRTPWQIAWRRLRADRVALAGGAFVILMIVAALCAPLLAKLEGQDPYTYHTELLDPNAGNRPTGSLGGISGAHWFGVEPLTGRDLFAIVMYGARTSLLIGLAATALSITIGALIGTASGYFSGWFDWVAGRVMDVMFGFPALIFMIALGIVAPASFPRWLLLILVIGFFSWATVGRVIRSQARSVSQRDFVDAARALGAAPAHLIFHQLLPNLVAPIIVFASISIPGTIGTETALSFLGVGIPAPTPDWGRSISDAVVWIQSDIGYLLFPGAALFLTVLAFNLLGDGLRDALDPRSGR